MTSHASLDAAATERKARLAKLKSLKRKQPTTGSEEIEISEPAASIPTENSQVSTPLPASQYLSGRNYDSETRGPKLGFENAPNENAETLEGRAAAIALETREKEDKERKEEKPIDLFQLQPRKPNWDLKRDVAQKMKVLNARTDNAIARLVRERIEGQKKKEKEKEKAQGAGGTDEENLGMGGVELVEGMHVREREEQEDERREREEAEEMA